MFYYKNNDLGRKYIRYIGGYSRYFISFIILGLGVIATMMLMVHIDNMYSYTARIVPNQGQTALSIEAVEASTINTGKAYLYSNKQAKIYTVTITGTDTSGETMTLRFNEEDQEIIDSLSANELFIDIPQGKETLLYRVFVKGGKTRG